MAVDTRFKRASVLSLLCPYMPTTHSDGVSGIDADERAGITWMYSGILLDVPAAAPLAMSPLKFFILPLDEETGMTISPMGNVLQVAQSGTVPTDEPPGGKGIVFYISGGALTIYVWDADTAGWVN
jgi:hypothetical protein